MNSTGSFSLHRDIMMIGTETCTACSYTSLLRDRIKEVDEALFDSTYLAESEAELALLDRAVALFARFPDSRHALKVGREQTCNSTLAR